MQNSLKWCAEFASHTCRIFNSDIPMHRYQQRAHRYVAMLQLTLERTVDTGCMQSVDSDNDNDKASDNEGH